MKRHWQAELAREAKCSRQYLNDVLAGRRKVSADRAAELEMFCAKCGIGLTKVDWLYPRESEKLKGLRG